MSFQVSAYRMETGKLLRKSGNCKGNYMETISLKALANKVLQRNLQGNHVETLSFHGGNFKEEYADLTTWLADLYKKYDFEYSLDIKQGYPTAHRKIQQSIDDMDTAIIREDLSTFRAEQKRFKNLFLEAVTFTGGN